LRLLPSAAVLVALVMGASSLVAAPEKPYLTLASTTSTNDSGLFASILPKFEADTGVQVRVVAVGTGQALEIGRRGDADALLVHDEHQEKSSLAFALSRIAHTPHGPTPFGVFRDVERPVYDELMAEQIATATERHGAGNLGERTYTLTYQSADALGNVASCDVVVRVPHDQRP